MKAPVFISNISINNNSKNKFVERDSAVVYTSL